MSPDKIKEYIQAVIEGITPLAQKLGIAVEYLFTWAIKHNYAIAGSYVIGFLLTILFTYPLYRLMKWGFKKEEGAHYVNFEEHEPIAIGTMLLTVCYTVMFLFFTAQMITVAIPRLIAPEWYTVQDIVNLARDKQTP